MSDQSTDPIAGSGTDVNRLLDEVERLQLLAADYGGQLTAANAEIGRLREDLRIQTVNAKALVDEQTKRQQAEHERDALVEQLVAVRQDAAETVAFWGGYAWSYFQEKHDLAADIKRFKHAANGTREQCGAIGHEFHEVCRFCGEQKSVDVTESGAPRPEAGDRAGPQVSGLSDPRK